MKKQLNEPDFIGGQGALTKEEELLLSKYFSKKKIKEDKVNIRPSQKSKSHNKAHA